MFRYLVSSGLLVQKQYCFHYFILMLIASYDVKKWKKVFLDIIDIPLLGNFSTLYLENKAFGITRTEIQLFFNVKNPFLKFFGYVVNTLYNLLNNLASK